MWEAYHLGRSVVVATHLERAELYVEQFAERGLPAPSSRLELSAAGFDSRPANHAARRAIDSATISSCWSTQAEDLFHQFARDPRRPAAAASAAARPPTNCIAAPRVARTRPEPDKSSDHPGPPAQASRTCAHAAASLGAATERLARPGRPATRRSSGLRRPPARGSRPRRAGCGAPVACSACPASSPSRRGRGGSAPSFGRPLASSSSVGSRERGRIPDCEGNATATDCAAQPRKNR